MNLPLKNAASRGSAIEFDDEDLKEVFALFTSCTALEKAQALSETGPHSYRAIDLDEEYSYTSEKREFALDALRSVLSFLHRKGYGLSDGKAFIDLGGIEDEFLP